MKIAGLILFLGAAAMADVAPHGRNRFNPTRIAERSSVAIPDLWNISPGGRYATSRGDTLRIHDTATGKELFNLDGHPDAGIHDGGWSLNGKVFATAGGNETVKVWDIPSGKEIASFTPHAGYS